MKNGNDIDNDRMRRWALSLNARESGNTIWNEWLIRDRSVLVLILSFNILKVCNLEEDHG